MTSHDFFISKARPIVALIAVVSGCDKTAVCENDIVVYGGQAVQWCEHGCTLGTCNDPEPDVDTDVPFEPDTDLPDEPEPDTEPDTEAPEPDTDAPQADCSGIVGFTCGAGNLQAITTCETLVQYEDCEFGCLNAECLPPPQDDCDPSSIVDFQCRGDAIYGIDECDGLHLHQTCQYGCSNGGCISGPTDADGDGWPADIDCDDHNSTINAPRTWCRDADGDGYGNPNVTTDACSRPSGYVASCADFDDGNRNSYPGAAELEDGDDNDNDGVVDEGFPVIEVQLFDDDPLNGPCYDSGPGIGLIETVRLKPSEIVDLAAATDRAAYVRIRRTAGGQSLGTIQLRLYDYWGARNDSRTIAVNGGSGWTGVDLNCIGFADRTASLMVVVP